MLQAATGNPLQLIAAERLSELGRDTREELTKLPDVVLIPHGRWHAEQIAVLLLEQIEVEAIRVTLGVASFSDFLSLSTALRASVIPIINLLQDAAGEAHSPKPRQVRRPPPEEDALQRGEALERS